MVAQHRIIDPETAFARGEKLVKNEGAPSGVVGLQFYPSRDGSPSDSRTVSIAAAYSASDSNMPDLHATSNTAMASVTCSGALTENTAST